MMNEEEKRKAREALGADPDYKKKALIIKILVQITIFVFSFIILPLLLMWIASLFTVSLSFIQAIGIVLLLKICKVLIK